MQNVSQPKVFEFAKEIGMETLALMDKIREWKLPVRSHMAELDAEMLETIRTRLNEDKAGKPAQGAKKKVARKAKAPAAGAEAAPAAAKKKVATKASGAVKKAASPAAESAGSGDGKKVVVKKAAPKVVVRRSKDEEKATDEAVSMAAPPAEVEEEIVETPVVAPAQAVSVPIEAVSSVDMEEEAPESTSAPSTAPSATVTEPVSAPEPSVNAAAQPVSAPQAAAPQIATSQPSATQAPTPQTMSAPTPARKREVVMTASGPVSGVRSEAPRRNIVGRMDLSRVTPPPSTGGPGSGPSRPGVGPRPVQRNLRTGFVAAAPVSLPDDENSERRRYEERKKKFGVAGAGPAPAGVGREREAENITFSATEFRKREMVFQPKKKKGMLSREAKQTQITTPKASKRIVKVNNTMKVGDLAQEMGIKAGQVVKTLMTNGVMATMNTDLDFDTIALVAPEFGFEAQNVHKTVDELIESAAFGNLEADLVSRAPVVTVMGHVDHGKTSLLDAIRKADVASREAGGITQHIGAYRVMTEDGNQITFIDTPGHEAFTAMRARGANVTDIAIIVVAADDGVMPQTAEAINHAKAAEVPIIVAVNKIDKAGADPDRIKRQLTEFELVPEEWGGSTIFVNTSATQKTGINEILEQILLVAEMEELRANPERSATGIVIESRMDKGRGAVATILVQDGTLKVGQTIVAGQIAGRVRSLMNDKGERVTEAGPSVPVEVLGLPEVPMAGDKVDVAKDEDDARRIAAVRREAAEKATSESKKLSLEDIFAKMKEGAVKELPIVLKTDVAGSSEAIKGMFEKIGTSEVKVKIIHTAIGGINESDVLLASTAKGIIVGFNVRPDSSASAAAKREGVEIKTYSIVYELMDDMKKALAGMLAPTIVEKELGRAEVRNTFTVPKVGTIAGCFITEGKILRSAQARLVRDGKVVYTGKIGSLKRFKDDAREVATGFECGIGIENFNDVKVGDVIEAFQTETVVRDLH